jgi:hypothetical protein
MHFYIVPYLFPQKTPEETVEPVSWTMFGLKMIGGFLILALFFLLMLYFRQESMLYVPSQPIQDFD